MSLIYGEVESELRNTNLSRLTPISPYFSGSAGRVLFYEDFEDEILRGWNYFDDNETGSYYNLTDTIKFSGKRSLHIRSPQVNTTTNAHLDLIKIFPFTIPTGSNPLIGMEVAFTFSRAFVGLGGPQLRFGLSTWDGTNRRDFYMRYNKGSHLWFWGASETESGSQRLEPYEPATNPLARSTGVWHKAKLIVDPFNDKYISFICNGATQSVSGSQSLKESDGSITVAGANIFRCFLRATSGTTVGQEVDVWFDDVVITSE